MAIKTQELRDFIATVDSTMNVVQTWGGVPFEILLTYSEDFSLKIDGVVKMEITSVNPKTYRVIQINGTVLELNPKYYIIQFILGKDDDWTHI